MNEQHFRANDWLEPIFSKKFLEFKDGSIEPEPKRSLPFNLLTPGWTGDGLVSKEALSIRATSEILWKNSIKLFSSFRDTNNNLKSLILSEYNYFVKNKDCIHLEFNSTKEFWPHLFENYPNNQKKEIKDFINIYCYRTVISYIYRIKFITALTKALNIKPTENHLFNPSGFLSKVFQQGGPRELSFESLQANSYSWYRPDPEYKELILKLSKELDSVNNIEFLKIFSNLPCLDSLPEFSHTLSHKNFGEFLNLLFVSFPDWINGNHESKNKNFLNIKFSGDFLYSIANSFWLSQTLPRPKNFPIIVPDFIGEGSGEGSFLKNCQELQFLTFLSISSLKQGIDPTLLICQTFKQKYLNFPECNIGQMNLFLNKGNKNEISYDRIILNFSKPPKKNPHYHLTQLINSQISSLSKDGFLFVFSNQNLFVSSHTERVLDILNSFKLEAYFNFEKLIGKGEITSFLYVFRKRSSKDQLNLLQQKKESFFSFRWSGNLSSFHNFHLLTKEFDYFLKNKNPFSNALYHKEIEQALNFEFLEDAVLNGVLLHSCSNDTSKVTHPNFFRNLTKYCVTFDNFFNIESVNPNDDFSKFSDVLTLELLGKKVRKEDRFPFILIVNLTNINDIRIEIIPSASYSAKSNENGFACFQYFGLIPKNINVSLNLFREYFQTDLGSQIIQLSLNSASKLKSKLKSLLVPAFFLNTESTNPLLLKNWEPLSYERDNLLTIHPMELLTNFERFKNNFNEIIKNSPLENLEKLINFKLTLELALNNIHSQATSTNIKYTNPIIKEKLSKLKLYSIFPSNKEIHFEFLSTLKDEINEFFSHSLLKEKDSIPFIELHSTKGPVLEIYSDMEILSFIQFLLNFTTGMPVLKIVYSLQVPKIQDIKSTLSNVEEIQKTFKVLLAETKNLISSLFIQKVFSSNSEIIH